VSAVLTRECGCHRHRRRFELKRKLSRRARVTFGHPATGDGPEGITFGRLALGQTARTTAVWVPRTLGEAEVQVDLGSRSLAINGL